MDEAKLDRMFELIQQEFARSRAETAELRAEMHAGMSSLRAEIHAGMSSLRAEMNAGIGSLRSEMQEGFVSIRFEMGERFQSVLDRLDLVENRVDKGVVALQDVHVEVGKLKLEVGNIKLEVGNLKLEVLKLDGRFDQMQMSVNGLGDDMRQRFRAVNDRLSALAA